MIISHQKFAINNGILLGSIYCLMTLGIYFIDVNLLFSGIVFPFLFWFFFFLFPIYVLIRNKLNLISFKDFFSVLFLVFVIGNLLYSLFSWFLYNILDPNLIILYGDVMLENMLRDSVTILQNEQELSSQYFAQNFSIKSQINAYVFFLIPCAIYSFLISFLMKVKT